MKHYKIMLVVLACALANIIASAVRAEEGITKASDLCIPHLQQQGPWICDLQTLNKTKCEGTPIAGLDDEWKVVQSQKDAYQLLKDKYRAFNDAKAFMSWLKCQGFRQAYVGKGQGLSVPNGSATSFHIGVEYARTEIEPYPLPFFSITRLTGWDEYQRFVIYLDDSGQIALIKVFKTL